MGLKNDDPRMKDSIKLAKEMGVDISFTEEVLSQRHPNEARIDIYDEDGEVGLSVLTFSTGGGMFEIVEMDGFPVFMDGSKEQIYVCCYPWAARKFYDKLERVAKKITVPSPKGTVLAFCNTMICAEDFTISSQEIDALVEELHPMGIWERNDVPVRRLEGLEQTTGLLYGEVPDRVEMVENGVQFWVDVKEGQKTGFFLDQKENRAAIAPFVKDKTVLDCFTHTGSFALHAGYFGAKEVTGVDISGYACEFATENAKLNHLEDRVHFVEANAFDLLGEQSRNGVQYDVVILDPPAFTKTRSAIESATRGYKEINLRAMKMVKPGGYLITCSCSQHILPDAFLQIVKDAAHDARVHLRQVEYRTQGKDHPILPGSIETQYLKCGIFQILD